MLFNCRRVSFAVNVMTVWQVLYAMLPKAQESAKF
jgi:hypothetical protein